MVSKIKSTEKEEKTEQQIREEEVVSKWMRAGRKRWNLPPMAYPKPTADSDVAPSVVSFVPYAYLEILPSFTFLHQ